MSEYHKIQTVFKRDPATNHKTLLLGEWSIPEFQYLADNEWEFTEKVDGTNIRVMIRDGVVQFGGKTDSAQIPATLVDRLNERFQTITARQRLAEVFPDGACLYGEGYGAKIQKGGGNYRQDQDFVLFDVLVGNFWLQRPDVVDIADKLDLEAVPAIGHGSLHDMIDIVQNGIVSRWGGFPAEGIVARPAVEFMTRNGSRIITKLKTRDFAR